LYAFDSNTAVIANAGAPAYVLRTEDGGKSWEKVYENTDSAAFIDGIDFWSDRKNGLIHGDPIKGRMLLLYTADGGNSWKERPGPELSKGEASFAASGTAINCFSDNGVLVATGGTWARLYVSYDKGERWKVINTPMRSGPPSSGIYSVLQCDYRWLLAGGDHTEDTVSYGNFSVSTGPLSDWKRPSKAPRGYRECLAKVYDNNKWTVFAVGPSGIDISTDGGQSWDPLSDEKGFHVIKAATDGKQMFLAGGKGKLAVMKPVE
jgi:photosystem II stability/assembly factor-like uncharacterized protein